jgi:pyruvate formate lyase activating enzyme
MVMNATDAYEFRTTVIREFHSPEEIVQIGKELCGARRLILQQFRPSVTLDPSLRHATAYTNDEMERLCTSVKPYIKECSWR